MPRMYSKNQAGLDERHMIPGINIRGKANVASFNGAGGTGGGEKTTDFQARLA